MIMNYVTKIRAQIDIYARKKTSNLFDGSYKSIYQGNGLDFENLREYIPGDNIRDIDWKASSRSGKVLVKRYIAEKRHNILLVFDTGIKMCAHTGKLEDKKELALNAGGVLGYLAAKNGDQVGALYNSNGSIQYYPLHSGLQNVEKIMTAYEREKCSGYESDLEKSLDYMLRNIRRKGIVFVITDMAGICRLSESILKKMTCQFEVLVVGIGDADVTNGSSFRVEGQHYIPEFFSSNLRLAEKEKELKESLQAENEKKLLKYRVVSTMIHSREEMVERLVELLGGHKYAGIR
ncbi:MAG: DUF58 domain-containing protein [Lachnospiraceae bacterium]|nr:DUF58 domain-containing protein [Lachnospiraceae bacterium]